MSLSSCVICEGARLGGGVPGDGVPVRNDLRGAFGDGVAMPSHLVARRASRHPRRHFRRPNQEVGGVDSPAHALCGHQEPQDDRHYTSKHEPIDRPIYK